MNKKEKKKEYNTKKGMNENMKNEWKSNVDKSGIIASNHELSDVEGKNFKGL